MPQFRKLHTKIIDSLDIDSMSCDFVRLTWTWLQLIACKEGRGLLHGGWLKGKLYPMRGDVTAEMMLDAMLEYDALGMITLYSDNKRDYFQINKWHMYQSTSREAPSPYPAPTQELVMSYSGVSPDELTANPSYLISSISSLNARANEENDATITALCNVCVNAGATDRTTLEIADSLQEQGRGAEWVTNFGEWWSELDNGAPFLKHLQTFGGHFDRGELPHFVKKNGAGKKEDIDKFLIAIQAAQRNGLNTKQFNEFLPPEFKAAWKALNMRWPDVKRLNEKQTEQLRFRLLEVAQ